MQDAAALLCLLFIGLQLIDYELTSGILKRGGRELNPMLRWHLPRRTARRNDRHDYDDERTAAHE